MPKADPDATTATAGFEPLVAALEGWFELPFDELPAELQTLVAMYFHIPWDILSPIRRREVALQSDYYRDPANDFEQEFWLALITRRSVTQAKKDKMERALTPDATAEAAQTKSLAQFDCELAALQEEEAELASIEPSEQRVAMDRIREQWRERDRHEAGLDRPIPQVADASSIGPQGPDGAPKTPASADAFKDCVECLRVLAGASPEHRIIRKELKRRCKGKLKEVAWRAALKEAFEGRTEWQKTGRRRKL